MEQIIEYLKEKYQPLALIVYGSYADGSNGEGSDFNCLIVSRSASIKHDTETVPAATMQKDISAATGCSATALNCIAISLINAIRDPKEPSRYGKTRSGRILDLF